MCVFTTQLYQTQKQKVILNREWVQASKLRYLSRLFSLLKKRILHNLFTKTSWNAHVNSSGRGMYCFITSYPYWSDCFSTFHSVFNEDICDFQMCFPGLIYLDYLFINKNNSISIILKRFCFYVSIEHIEGSNNLLDWSS